MINPPVVLVLVQNFIADAREIVRRARPCGKRITLQESPRGSIEIGERNDVSGVSAFVDGAKYLPGAQRNLVAVCVGNRRRPDVRAETRTEISAALG